MTLPLRPLRPAPVPQPPPERGAGPADPRARMPGSGSGRPLLPAALRPVWRSDGALQLGLDPDRAVVVDGIDEPTARALLALDGTRTEAEVLTAATGAGLDPDAIGHLLADLRDAGVLAEVRPPAPPPPRTQTGPAGGSGGARTGPDRGPGPGAQAGPADRPDVGAPDGPAARAASTGSGRRGRAGTVVRRGAAGREPERDPTGAGRAAGPVGAAGRIAPDLASLSLLPGPQSPFEVMRGRRAAGVVVHGAGRVGASLATLLAAAGVGRVHVADRGPVRPGDVAPAGVPAADVDRSRAAAAVDALRRVAPEVHSGAPPPGHRPDLVVLASVEPVDTGLRTALVRGRVPHLVVGVRETTAVIGPLVLPGRTGCLRCGDLHRADRDPAWPVVAAQLIGIRRRRDEPCDVALATLAAALAALQCLAHLDGRPPAATGASLELGLADWRLRRRTWPAHSRCDCGAAA
ncbi:MAG TPA: ThiF family adenylyltransferase [Mycobacteriales bacterium]